MLRGRHIYLFHFRHPTARTNRIRDYSRDVQAAAEGSSSRGGRGGGGAGGGAGEVGIFQGERRRTTAGGGAATAMGGGGAGAGAADGLRPAPRGSGTPRVGQPNIARHVIHIVLNPGFLS